MTYAKLDDNAPWNPKVQALTDAEFRAWIGSICYASQYRTDGHFPAQAVRAIGASARVKAALVAKGFWEANGTGYYVHDYLEHQRSREQIEAARKAGLQAALFRHHGGD